MPRGRSRPSPEPPPGSLPQPDLDQNQRPESQEPDRTGAAFHQTARQAKRFAPALRQTRNKRSAARGRARNHLPDPCPNQISITQRDPSHENLTEQARLSTKPRGRPNGLRRHSAKQETNAQKLPVTPS